MMLRQFAAGLEFDERQENIHLVDYYFDNRRCQKVFKLENDACIVTANQRAGEINQCNYLIGWDKYQINISLKAAYAFGN